MATVAVRARTPDLALPESPAYRREPCINIWEQVLCRVPHVNDKLACSLVCKSAHLAFSAPANWKLLDTADVGLPHLMDGIHEHTVRLQSVFKLLRKHAAHVEVLMGMSRSPADYNFWVGAWQILPNLRKLVWKAPIEFLVLSNMLMPFGPPASVTEAELSLYGCSTSEWTVQDWQWDENVRLQHVKALGFTSCLTKLHLMAPGEDNMGQRGVIDLSNAKLRSCTHLTMHVSSIWKLPGLHAPKLKHLEILSKELLIVHGLPDLPSLESLTLGMPAEGPPDAIHAVELRRCNCRSLRKLSLRTGILIDVDEFFKQVDCRRLESVNIEVYRADLSHFDISSLMSSGYAGSFRLGDNQLRCTWTRQPQADCRR